MSQQLPLAQAPPRFNPHLPSLQGLNSPAPQQPQIQQSSFNDLNVFRAGGLVQQNAPNLVTPTPNIQGHSHSVPIQAKLPVQSHINHQQNVQGFAPSNSELIQAVPKFEHHITETINSPILVNSHSINMDFSHSTTTAKSVSESHHRFALNGQGVSNHFSDVFPQEKQQRPQGLPQIDPRVKSHSQVIASTYRPSTTTATPPPTTTPKKVSNYVLPDEVPDDLRGNFLVLDTLTFLH